MIYADDICVGKDNTKVRGSLDLSGDPGCPSTQGFNISDNRCKPMSAYGASKERISPTTLAHFLDLDEIPVYDPNDKM
jgi:hypothetical protein